MDLGPIIQKLESEAAGCDRAVQRRIDAALEHLRTAAATRGEDVPAVNFTDLNIDATKRTLNIEETLQRIDALEDARMDHFSRLFDMKNEIGPLTKWLNLPWWKRIFYKYPTSL